MVETQLSYYDSHFYGLPSELNVKAEYDFGKYIKTIGNGHQLQYLIS